jgi:ABC-2 type transport system ATP-binding protein
MIEIDGLTKRYGDKTAVDGLSFVVEPGVVTGFLGPNGAGKSTTMRMIAGLDRPTSGTVRVNGKHYPGAAAPMALARTAGIGRRRVDEVIELAGLGEVAGTRAGGFSLGMGQRLGVAAALLGQPATVVLDEPVNGLDPDGVRWIRLLLKSLAAEGRTVFVSSHLMSEMAQTATRLVVLGRGQLISQTSVEDFTGQATAGGIVVRTPETGRLGQLLAAPGVTVTSDGTDLLRVSGITAEQIGERRDDRRNGDQARACPGNSSGMIRATLAAVPSRLPVLWAKRGFGDLADRPGRAADPGRLGFVPDRRRHHRRGPGALL